MYRSLYSLIFFTFCFRQTIVQLFTNGRCVIKMARSLPKRRCEFFPGAIEDFHLIAPFEQIFVQIRTLFFDSKYPTILWNIPTVTMFLVSSRYHDPISTSIRFTKTHQLVKLMSDCFRGRDGSTPGGNLS